MGAEGHGQGVDDMGIEESHIVRLRRLIEEQYEEHSDPAIANSGFGVILCHEIHTKDLHFIALSEKWGISLSILGELIWDHCKRLADDPVVNHFAEDL